MAEEPVIFHAGDVKLEGRLAQASADSSRPLAVICHPHPVYGGTMDNNVVMAIANTLQETGHSTLRFNFRGTGRSEGHYDGGKGEIEDVRAAIRFIRDRLGCESPIVLAGYSFGSWVCANALEGDKTVSHIVMVAPPTSMFDFSALSDDEEERVRHFIVGDRDQFCDRDILKELYDGLSEPKTFRVVPGADHFFFAHERGLAEAVKEAIADHV